MSTEPKATPTFDVHFRAKGLRTYEKALTAVSAREACDYAEAAESGERAGDVRVYVHRTGSRVSVLMVLRVALGEDVAEVARAHGVSL